MPSPKKLAKQQAWRDRQRNNPKNINSLNYYNLSKKDLEAIRDWHKSAPIFNSFKEIDISESPDFEDEIKAIREEMKSK
jgi:hypothetical protein